MKLFVASGYYDLATPYFATEYTLSHLGLDPSQQRQHQHARVRGRPHDVHPARASWRG